MRPIPASLLLGLGLALAGCGPVNRGLSALNQPVVSRSDYVLDVSPEGLRGGVDGAEARRLAGWFEALGLDYGDSVAIDDRAAYPDEAVRDTVAAVLAKQGMLLSNARPVTVGEPVSGTIRIVVSRSLASVPGCPNWRAPSQPNFAESTMSNFGCATNSNLAAMIANPEDLVHGQTAGGQVDARTATKAIKGYRDAAPTGAGGVKQESSKGGN